MPAEFFAQGLSAIVKAGRAAGVAFAVLLGGATYVADPDLLAAQDQRSEAMGAGAGSLGALVIGFEAVAWRRRRRTQEHDRQDAWQVVERLRGLGLDVSAGELDSAIERSRRSADTSKLESLTAKARDEIRAEGARGLSERAVARADLPRRRSEFDLGTQ